MIPRPAISLSTLALLILAPIPAAAREAGDDGRTYVALKAGAVRPVASDMTDYLREGHRFGTGPALEAAFGYFANRYVALELGGGYFSTSASKTEPVGAAERTYDWDLSVIPVTLSVRLNLPLDRLQVYGLLGAGRYWMSGRETLSETTGFSDKLRASDSPYAVHAGLGSTWQVTSRLSAGAEGRYVVGFTKALHFTASPPDPAFWFSQFPPLGFDSLIVQGVVALSL